MIEQILEHSCTKELRKLKIEAVVVFFVTNDRLLSHTVQLFGKESFTIVPDVARIVKVAKREGATGVVLIHNHPARLPESFKKCGDDANIERIYSTIPSRADILSAKGIFRELTRAGIVFIDDIIVAGPLYYSLRENGYLGNNGRFGVYDYRLLEFKGELYMLRLNKPVGWSVKKLMSCQDIKEAQMIVCYSDVPEKGYFGFK